MVAHSGAIMSAFRRAIRAVDRSAASAARDIERDFRLVVSQVYPPASSPGSPPHMRTGKYRDSIKANAKGSNQFVSKIDIESHSSVGLWLEYGTYRDGRPYMLPRPHWRTHLPTIVRTHLPDRIKVGIERAER